MQEDQGTGTGLELDLTPSGTPSPRGRLAGWEPANWSVDPGWLPAVETFFASPAGERLASFVRARLAMNAVIYPPQPLRALELTPLAKVRVVVLGQDPYHNPGQAEGLAFSVAPGVQVPPSLRNIFKELQRDLRLPPPANGSLVRWARQGVLLLNSSLTVEYGEPASHAKKGWEALTDALIAEVAAQASPCVYLLWGVHAQAKGPLIRNLAERHGREALVLEANHPSPLSAMRPPVPFLGCGHFGEAQRWLAERGVTVDWSA
jgi:uracil-DNA glycosylase